MFKNSSKVAIYARFDFKIGISMADLLEQKSGIAPKAPMATSFGAKKVFKNEGVNQGSNFPGPALKPKLPATQFVRKNVLALFGKRCPGQYV